MATTTVEDIRQYIEIPQNYREADLANRIREAEFADIRPQIGEAFLADLDANPVSGDNAAALDLLKPAVSYYAFARHILNGQNHTTKSGFVKKENEYSSPVSLKELSQKAGDNRSLGLAYLEKFIKYVEENKQSFPLYNSRGNFRKLGSKIAQSRKT